MSSSLSRRDFLKIAAWAAGGAAATLVGVPLVWKEQAVFDPNTSFWALEQPSPNPPLQENLDVDIAIIGGGFTGLSAAYHLAREYPDLNIILLEARRVGDGASGRNGGMLLPQTGPETMKVSYDDETHRWTYDLTVQSMHALERLAQADEDHCDLQLTGYLHTIYRQEDVPYYQDYVARVQKMGLPLRFLSREETRAALGTERYFGAVYDPNGGSIHPMKWIRTLKKAAENLGVRIYENTQVLGIQEGERILLQTGDFRVRAGEIVLATNAYTSKLGYFRDEALAVHTQVAATEPLTEAQLQALGWRSRLPFYDSRYFLYHLLLTPDNRIVIGGGSAEYFFNNGLHYQGSLSSVAAMLRTELETLYPALQGIGFDAVWDGVLSLTYDEFEAVGLTGRHENIYYALAYNGHGVNLSFLFGQVIAYLHGGRKHGWEYTAYANTPLRKMPQEPLRWLGAQAFLAYYHWLDA